MKKQEYRYARKPRPVTQEEDDFDVGQFGEYAPAHDIELESAVLGVVMLEHRIMDRIAKDFSRNLFFKKEHAIIADSIIEMYQLGVGIDILTVTNHLKTKGELDKVGGPYYVTQLTNRVSSGSNTEFHIKILQQHSLKRSLLKICSEGIHKAFDDETDVFDLYSGVQRDLEDSMKGVLNYDVEKIFDIHKENIEESIQIAKEGKESGVPCGLKRMDKVTNGWQKADLIILAGRPSMGKTAAAVSMAIFPALEKNIPVAIFSVETSKHQLVGRIQSGLSGVNASRIVTKRLTMDEIEVIDNSCKKLYTAPIYIDDTAGLSLIEFTAKSRMLVKDKGVQLIVVDYLQLMTSGLNISNREQEIATISRGLKRVAKELDVPVIALSQLARNTEGRPDKIPVLSDLRESGQIEQDADMVIFCYRPEYYKAESYVVDGQDLNTHGLFMFLVQKHRNGELGEIPAKFIHEQIKVVNWEIEEAPRTNFGGTFVTSLNKNSDNYIQKEEDPPF